MDKLQAIELVRQARALVEGVNARLSALSEKYYVAAFARMQRAALVPEKIANTANCYYFYRAALVHHHASHIRSILHAADLAALAFMEDEWVSQVQQLKEHILALQRYKPDPTGNHLARGLVGNWSVEAEKRQRAGIKIAKHSKRVRLRGLPSDWRTQMFEGLGASKYHAAVAVLSTTGARPAEIALGVQVALADDGQLVLTIQGVKTHGGKYGQERRTLTVRPETKEAQFLVAQVRAAGTPITVSAKASSLSERIRLLSTKVFPKLVKPISAYVFRHQMAADLKASGMASADVSAALGHCVDETKRYYGTAKAARGSGGVSKVQASRQVKERTPERIRELERNYGFEHTRDRDR